MRRFLDKTIWIFLAGNKFVAKIKLAPFYTLDMILLLYILSINPFKILRWTARLWPALLVLLQATIWFTYDISQANGAWRDYEYMLRRYAMGVYFVIPILLFSGGLEVIKYIQSRYIMIVFTTLSFYLLWRLNLIEYSPSWAAFVIGVLLIYHIGKIMSMSKPKAYDIYITYIIILILIIITKDPGGGFYRSPLLALMAGAIYLIINGIIYQIKKIHIIIYSASILLLSFMSIAFYFTPPGEKFYKEIYCSSAAIIKANDSAGSCSLQRSRGDPVGTIKTRLSFWAAIVEYNTSDPIRFFFGSGHRKAFLEVVPTNEILQPMQARSDAALIEPHNSYMGLYFRYGIMGMLLFVSLLMLVSRACVLPRPRWSRAAAIGIRIMALVYITTEVALEVPYGAMIFWLVWLLTCNVAPRFAGKSLEKAGG